MDIAWNPNTGNWCLLIRLDVAESIVIAEGSLSYIRASYICMQKADSGRKEN